MTVRRIEPGKRMSQAVIHNGTVYLAGQVGTPGKPVAEQTKEVLASIDRLLAEAGTDKSKLIQATIWLADMRDFAAMNEVKNILPGIDQIIIYVVAILILLTRPRGLMGRKGVMEE